MEYAARLGIIAPEQFQAALDRFAMCMLDDILCGWASVWRRTNHPDLSLREWREPLISAGDKFAGLD